MSTFELYLLREVLLGEELATQAADGKALFTETQASPRMSMGFELRSQPRCTYSPDDLEGDERSDKDDLQRHVGENERMRN
jgi:hypothetical protein